MGYQRYDNALLLIHELTVKARRRVDRSGLSRRELARRLGTFVPQPYWCSIIPPTPPAAAGV
jgi:hypothetical protein